MDQKFELRALKASDFFLVTRILSKIGVKEFKAIMEGDDIKAAISKMASQQDGELADADVASIGMTVVLDMALIKHEGFRDFFTAVVKQFK